ncbi:DUF2939 domain-containing protein [Microbulbifer hydrolyticus]|uniref:DUF2939 domain-containing protein n=1 Tax=Microbulbifer hydrolyticus TaxID=48074 RepID=A0A6P1T4P3_9GAMM|nr:DUF2939 domain-containing protein [Microbulbifer hydrolyticus]MBB5211542.1 hypothetical protein [Microbulbifer hydrolyticus]QHQ37718.1 DUF2939 domain-containing protein [Microbulbifer hydrolyticus]
MGKWLLRAGLVLILLAGSYAALPWYSARQLIEAAHHEDMAGLARYVDFPRLRMNIRARLKSELQESMGAELPPELGGLFSAGADMLLGPLLDRLISPEGISDLIQGRKDWREFERDLERAFGNTGRTPAPTQPPETPSIGVGGAGAHEHGHRWKLSHWHFSGLNSVEVICGNQGDASSVKLILQRKGLRWQLVDLYLINGQQTER